MFTPQPKFRIGDLLKLGKRTTNLINSKYSKLYVVSIHLINNKYTYTLCNYIKAATHPNLQYSYNAIRMILSEKELFEYNYLGLARAIKRLYNKIYDKS